jgi:hypothetical protein
VIGGLLSALETIGDALDLFELIHALFKTRRRTVGTLLVALLCVGAWFIFFRK